MVNKSIFSHSFSCQSDKTDSNGFYVYLPMAIASKARTLKPERYFLANYDLTKEEAIVMFPHITKGLCSAEVIAISIIFINSIFKY